MMMIDDGHDDGGGGGDDGVDGDHGGVEEEGARYTSNAFTHTHTHTHLPPVISVHSCTCLYDPKQHRFVCVKGCHHILG